MEIWDKSNKNYIVDFDKESDDEIVVIFADGNTLNVPYSKSMEKKLIGIMEEQYNQARKSGEAKRAITKFRNSKVATLLSGVACGGAMISGFINELFDASNEKAIACTMIGFGCLTLASIVSMRENESKANEAKLLEKRNKYSSVLDNIPTDSQAIYGHENIGWMIEEGQNPFNIHNITRLDLTAEDLERIVAAKEHEDFVEKISEEIGGGTSKVYKFKK